MVSLVFVRGATLPVTAAIYWTGQIRCNNAMILTAAQEVFRHAGCNGRDEGDHRPGHSHDGIQQGVGYGYRINPRLGGGYQEGRRGPVVGALFLQPHTCGQHTAGSQGYGNAQEGRFEDRAKASLTEMLSYRIGVQKNPQQTADKQAEKNVYRGCQKKMPRLPKNAYKEEHKFPNAFFLFTHMLQTNVKQACNVVVVQRVVKHLTVTAFLYQGQIFQSPKLVRHSRFA